MCDASFKKKNTLEKHMNLKHNKIYMSTLEMKKNIMLLMIKSNSIIVKTVNMRIIVNTVNMRIIVKTVNTRIIVKTVNMGIKKIGGGCQILFSSRICQW